MILVVPPKFMKFLEADLKKRCEKLFRIERAEAGKSRVSFSSSLKSLKPFVGAKCGSCIPFNRDDLQILEKSRMKGKFLPF